jgi:response regulator RpfG family c-di-GMP phosphodiesterase
MDSTLSQISLLSEFFGSTAAVNRHVLVVDREASTHETFRSILCPHAGGAGAGQGEASPNRFVVEAVDCGEKAVLGVERAIRERRPFAVVFMDIEAPSGWNGVETVSRLWEVDPDLHVVMCVAGSEAAADIVDRCGESDRLLILKKPFSPIEVRLLAAALCEKWNSAERARVEMRNLVTWMDNSQRVLHLLQESHSALEAAHLAAKNRATKLAMLVQQRTVEAIGTRDIAVLTLSKLAESRDPETGLHLERMRSYTQLLADHLSRRGPYAGQLDSRFLEDLFRASPMHDIGKVGIPDEILLKPGPLTPDEFEIMKQHTTIGATALGQVAQQSDYANFLHMAGGIARSHHERWDGRGYPDGLRGEAIPLPARIVALADVFDAMTSVRVYKDAIIPDQARWMIETHEAGHFDPAVLEAFQSCYDEFLEVYATADMAKSR